MTFLIAVRYSFGWNESDDGFVAIRFHIKGSIDIVEGQTAYNAIYRLRISSQVAIPLSDLCTLYRLQPSQ